VVVETHVFLFAKHWCMCKNRPMDRKIDIIIKAIPYDFPVCKKPYENIAKEAGISEDKLIKTLKDLTTKGAIRRIAAILYHRKAAYMFNAMVVWEIPEHDVERVGKVMSSFPEVTHCYEREKGDYWNYNVFTMVHSRSLEDCKEIVQRIAKKTGITTYKMFLSKREFKKTSLMVNSE
jgi:DNA-binding Lrp family transcriptional regulator